MHQLHKNMSFTSHTLLGSRVQGQQTLCNNYYKTTS